MARAVTSIAAGLAVLLASGSAAGAHALAQRYDLPMPLWLFLLGAGTAVALSFVVLALFMRRPKPAAPAALDDPPLASGAVPNMLAVAVQIVSVAVLALIIAAGLLGHQNPFKNIAPVAVWVIWWVGLTLLSAFVCNLWPLISPWAAAFDLAEGLARRCTGGGLSLRRRYPARLAAWPACVLLLLFAWFELVATNRDVPRNIAIAAAIYSGFTFAGFVVFGRDVWARNGEVFAVAFGLVGRFAPLRLQENRRWSLHPYATGLLTRQPLDVSMTAFTLIMLATVTVDGLMETPLWASIVERFFSAADPANADSPRYMLLASALLVTGPLLLAALYLAVVGMMAWTAGAGSAPLAGMFVLSLVPIAIAYHLAHYFSLLMLAGQFIIPLASDPFGYGWDLFGTMLYRIDIGIVDARFIWYLALVAIVTGHIVAVWLAHATAFAVYADAGAARRSQYPMLVLMIGYTMLSLWILAQPIVEPGAAS